MPNGKLITFEGIDGSGKSTQAKILYERLLEEHHDCELFREPGGTPLGEQVRVILLNQPEKIGIIAELLLFSAARAELVRLVIEPMLERGCIVLLDRFTDSTTAYQGYGRGIDLELVKSVNDAATQGIKPDLTFLFDVTAEDGLRRHDRHHDRIEQEGVQFMEKVRQGYLTVAKGDPARVVVVDGGREVEDLTIEVWNKVEVLLTRNTLF